MCHNSHYGHFYYIGHYGTPGNGHNYGLHGCLFKIQQKCRSSGKHFHAVHDSMLITEELIDFYQKSKEITFGANLFHYLAPSLVLQSDPIVHPIVLGILFHIFRSFPIFTLSWLFIVLDILLKDKCYNL